VRCGCERPSLDNLDAFGEGGGGTGGLAGQGVLSEPYASSHVQRDGRDYVVQNNVWGADGAQVVNYFGTTFEIVSVEGQGNTSGAPLSYPSVFIGSNNDRTTDGSNLPIQVSAIQSVQTTWSWSDAGVSGEYNAAYDVWFGTSSGGENDAMMLPVAPRPERRACAHPRRRSCGAPPLRNRVTRTVRGGATSVARP